MIHFLSVVIAQAKCCEKNARRSFLALTYNIREALRESNTQWLIATFVCLFVYLCLSLYKSKGSKITNQQRIEKLWRIKAKNLLLDYCVLNAAPLFTWLRLSVCCCVCKYKLKFRFSGSLAASLANAIFVRVEFITSRIRLAGDFFDLLCLLRQSQCLQPLQLQLQPQQRCQKQQLCQKHRCRVAQQLTRLLSSCLRFVFVFISFLFSF